jgi:hypothetical protein
VTARPDFISYEDRIVRRSCRIHPQIDAVVDVHNLQRDEHMVLCPGCFYHWLGKASFDFGIANALSDAYATMEPFASEIAAEHLAAERGT